jgi:hypothetical protein
VVEQPIRNRQVVGSTPTLGSTVLGGPSARDGSNVEIAPGMCGELSSPLGFLDTPFGWD